MKTTDSIKRIKLLINLIDQEISEVVLTLGQYGEEQEYTHQELLDVLNSLLTDLKTLIENPDQLLSLSTLEERNTIRANLLDCKNNLSDPNSLLKSINALTKNIQPFNIRYTSERFLTTKRQLTELENEKTKLQHILAALRQNIKITENNQSESDEILKSLTNQQDGIKEQLKDLTSIFNHAQSHLQEYQDHTSIISQFKNTVDSHQPVIDTFVQKIAEREQQLEDQKAKTDTYNSQLSEFTVEHKKRLDGAEDIIKKAKTALGYREAEGISASFKTRLGKLEDVKLWKNANTYWLSIAILFSGITIWMGYDFIQAIKNTVDIGGGSGITLNWILARFSIFTLPIAAIWFCAGQYVQNKNITEDYAYKTVLAQSIIGFSEQLKTYDPEDPTDTSYQEYVKKMLDEIHQHPLKNHKKHSDRHSPITNTWERPKENNPPE